MKIITRFIKIWILPPIIALFYWLWTRTWRIKVFEHPQFLEALHNGRIIFAHWHGHELVMVMFGPRYHCAAITSLSDDGELMGRVLSFFGYKVSRGSSSRSGARAIIGMLGLMREGFNATVAVDGPRGPRFKAKPGIWSISKHAGAPIITIGVAKKSALVFNKSWNKAFIPWPFTKVIVSFGKPLVAKENESEAEMCNRLENAIHEETKFAESKLLSLILAFFCAFSITACSTAPEAPAPVPGSLEAFMRSAKRTQLTPVAKSVTGFEPPVITYVLPNSRAAKYGFKVGDRILKVNGKDLRGFVEFEKKIKNLPPQMEIQVKSKHDILTKNVLLSEEHSRFGASTEPQNLAFVKKTSPTVVTLNKGPVMTVASASVDQDEKNLFINFVVDSKSPTPNQMGMVTILDAKTGKVLAESTERIDALGSRTLLVAKKFPLKFSISDGVLARLSFGKHQFTFEFQD